MVASSNTATVRTSPTISPAATATCWSSLSTTRRWRDECVAPRLARLATRAAQLLGRGPAVRAALHPPGAERVGAGARLQRPLHRPQPAGVLGWWRADLLR